MEQLPVLHGCYREVLTVATGMRVAGDSIRLL